MTKFLAFLSFALFSVAFSGCIATGNQKMPYPDQNRQATTPGKARIYVLRPLIWEGGLEWDVKDNGELIGELGAKRYLCWERQPGPVRIDVLRGYINHNESFNAEAGKSYYLLMDMGMIWTLEPISEAKGQELLAKCKQSPVKASE